MNVEEHIADLEKQFAHWDGQPRGYLRDLIMAQHYVDWNYAQALKRISDQLDHLTHACPPDGSGVMPCCGKTPFEVPPTDRITQDPNLVTCHEKPTNRESQ